MSSSLKITKETFQGYPVESKLDTLFDFTKAIHDQTCLMYEKSDKRLEKLERRKWFDKGAAFVGGLVGGVSAALGIRIGSQ